MNRYLYSLGALALLGFSIHASAQTYREHTYRPFEPLSWHAEAGYSPTLGSTSQYFDGGWTLGGGVTWRLRPDQPFALRADVLYSHFGATRNLIAINQRFNRARIDEGYADVVGLNVDGEYKVHFTPWVSGFALGGIGVAHMHIALTQTVAFGTYVCNPWFGFCAYGLAPGDVVVASGDATRFAWNAGVGLDFLLRNGQTFFVEVRYQRLEASPPTEFVPLTVGLRF